MVVGPAVQDLWLALSGRDAEALRQREVFLDGYEQFRDFDRSTLALIEPLRGLRMIHYAAWLAKRWHDPSSRRPGRSSGPRTTGSARPRISRSSSGSSAAK